MFNTSLKVRAAQPRKDDAEASLRPRASLMSTGKTGVRAVLVAAVCAVVLLVGAGSALAEEAKFESTGKQQEFKVPTGVTSVSVTAVGAKGGEGYSGVSGGFGALVSARLPVTPGQTLYVEVGSNGCSWGCGKPAFGGGGEGTRDNGAGGGASDVREKPEAEGEASLLSRLLVASGGGGGGSIGVNGAAVAGGPGGSGDAEALGVGGGGGNGASASVGAEGGEGGKGATKTEGGKGGHGGFGGYESGGWGSPGVLGAGGGFFAEGGGGGGGLYGGGAGGASGVVGTEYGGDGGGGAGSSFVAASGSNPRFETDTTGKPEVRITYAPPPTVTKVTPSSGPVTGGKSVTITGTNFQSVEAVKFGGVAVSKYAVNETGTAIVVESPPKEVAGTVDITVTTAGGTTNITTKDHYTYRPVITKVEPNTGSVAGGQVVWVFGAGFEPGYYNASFSFGTATTTELLCSNVECEVISPPHAAGTVGVKIRVNGATSAGTKADKYTYE